jgi:tRNA (guanine6-N2)-methyltransferase
MARHRPAIELPACYATVQPGLEALAGEEIADALGGEVKRSAPGIVVFRLAQIDHSVLDLRTTEDVFLLAWGTDQLEYKAADLKRIRKWTERSVDWERLLRIHHAIRPKPKGKPNYRLVVQMHGEHGYRRVDAREALVKGLAGKLPASWRHVDENAAVEIWLTIDGATAVCGLRLSDRSMRHRTYKEAHRPASLRPTVAAAMTRLADVRPGHFVLDPMCGAGTILGEVLFHLNGHKARQKEKAFAARVLGGDLDLPSLRAAAANLRRLDSPWLACWDAKRLPLADGQIDRLLCNPPFGVQLGDPQAIRTLYPGLVAECDRVTRPGGRVVMIVAEPGVLKDAARSADWKLIREVRLRILGRKAAILVFQT